MFWNTYRVLRYDPFFRQVNLPARYLRNLSTPHQNIQSDAKFWTFKKHEEINKSSSNPKRSMSARIFDPGSKQMLSLKSPRTIK